MSIRVCLINQQSGISLDNQYGFTDQSTLITESLARLNSKWKSGVNDAAETIDIVVPAPNESLFITDIIITSSKKISSSTIVLQFYDGTNTETIMEIEGVSAPVEFSHTFAGGLCGWKNAKLQVITDQAAMHVVTLVCYVRVAMKLTKTYAEWSADR
jgi:hypothetical protein